MTPQQLSAALPPNSWLDQAVARVSGEPAAIAALFPAVGRHCGRAPLPDAPGWTADDAARVVLLAALPLRGSELAAEVQALYRYGDAAEKRAVLRGLAWLDLEGSCVDLLHDALRTNDTRLVAAALGGYARHLDDASWRQGVLKCVFMSIPLAGIDGLTERADAELVRMLAGLDDERRAAGREMPADAVELLSRLTPEKVV
ncbi:MAG TPA: EboA domain-containing protein [Micromonosporaceae bacterium]